MVCCLEFEYDDLLDIKVGLNKKPIEDSTDNSNSNKEKKESKENNDNGDEKEKNNNKKKTNDNNKNSENKNNNGNESKTAVKNDSVDVECELKENWYLGHMNSICDNTCIELNKCKHIFHARCVSKWFYQSSTCPMCRVQYGIRLGKQPQDGLMRCEIIDSNCTGFPKDMRTIKLIWAFPPGVQTKRHNNPGMPYGGETREGFLPYNKMGILICKMFIIAFDRLLMFTIDTSLTRQHYYGDNTEGIVWAGIHVKTSYDTSAKLHGYSKDLKATQIYFENVLDELKQRNIEPKDVLFENNNKYDWTAMGFGFLDCEYGDEIPPPPPKVSSSKETASDNK